jgi:hypothetical protein
MKTNVNMALSKNDCINPVMDTLFSDQTILKESRSPELQSLFWSPKFSAQVV